MRREKIAEMLDAIVADPGDWGGKIGQFVRGVGHELPRKRLDVLRELRSSIDRRSLNETQDGHRDSVTAFLNGVMFAVVQLCAAYDAEVQAEYRPKSSYYDGLGCFTCGDVAYTNGLTFKDLMREGMLAFVEGRPVFVKHFKCCPKYVEPEKKE